MESGWRRNFSLLLGCMTFFLVNCKESNMSDINLYSGFLNNSSIIADSKYETIDYYDYYNIIDRANNLLSKPHRIIALILIVIVITSNICSLAAIYHSHGKVTSHFRLLISLAASDIFVAMSTFLHIVNKVTNPGYMAGYGPYDARLRSRCSYVFIKSLNTIGLNITLLNLMGMAVDHYIAILRPLHHCRLMNSTRTSVMIVCLWCVALLCGFSDFLCPIWEYSDYIKWRHKFNYCEFVWLSKYHEEYTVFAIAFIAFLSMLYMYIRIYIRVWRHQRARSSSQQATQRSKKTLITTLLILGTFVLCYLPVCTFNISLIVLSKLNETVVQEKVNRLVLTEKYLFNLVLLNGVCDPIIYAVRIREIQLGYRMLFGRCCSFLFRYSKYQRHTFVRERPSSFQLSVMDAQKRGGLNYSYGASCASNQTLNSALSTGLLLDRKVGKSTSLPVEMYA